MALVDYFLKMDGIDGESSDKEHKDEIEVLSFSWGVTQTGIIGGGGGGAGKANFQDFHFTASFNKASPLLFLSCATGKHIKQAVLIGRNNRTQQEFVKMTFSDILISSYQTGAASDQVPTDQISMNYAKIEYSGHGFDVRQNEPA